MISTREWITDSRYLNSYNFTDDMKEISAAALGQQQPLMPILAQS